MKAVFRNFTLVLTIAISLAGIGLNARTTPDKLGQIAQRSETAKKQQLLGVAVPDSAIVRLKQGGSYTGGLTAFNSRNLALAAGGVSETVPLSQIKEVVFQGDVWIVTPEGTKKRVPIRGLTIPLEPIPVTAFKLENPPQRAMLNLETLTKEEFGRLSSQTDRIHVVKKMLFESPETMTIRIVGARR